MIKIWNLEPVCVLYEDNDDERVVVDEAFGESHSLYQNGRAKSLQTAELGRWR